MMNLHGLSYLILCYSPGFNTISRSLAKRSQPSIGYRDLTQVFFHPVSSIFVRPWLFAYRRSVMVYYVQNGIKQHGDLPVHITSEAVNVVHMQSDADPAAQAAET